MVPFNQVYRMKPAGSDAWTIVMGLTPYPDGSGLWVAVASEAKPAATLLGKVFEGDDGRIVVVGEHDRCLFEPLTLSRFDEMRDSISGFDAIRGAFATDTSLQSWYWDEFAHNGEGVPLDQADIARRLAAQVKPTE